MLLRLSENISDDKDSGGNGDDNDYNDSKYIN